VLESRLRKIFIQKIGNSTTKFVFIRLAYCEQVSINELALSCEISPNKVLKSLDFLTENNFIRQRDGCIPSYTNDINDTVYQFEIIKRN